jgi:hypothetical protein
MLDRATFLGWREQTLYEALLAGDAGALQPLVEAVRKELLALAPRQVICEAVELYNPLHDLTLPIVRAAAAGLPDVEILEFPLIAQEPAAEERYRLQRFPAERMVLELHLNAAELEHKLRVRDREYRSLQRSTESVAAVSRECAATEVFARAADAFPVPGRDHVLRYEWRARLLHERGEIEHVITFAEHFVPVARALSQVYKSGG